MQRMQPHTRGLQRGFSLIELMVVVVILGLLSGVVIVAVGHQSDEARVTAREGQVKQLFDAVEQYKLDCVNRGIRPILPESLEQLLDGPVDWRGEWSPSIRRIPDNPWGHPYEYRVDDMDAGYFSITCYGRSGREGGEGYDEDFVMSHPPQRD